MGTHPIFESDFDCLTEKMDQFVPTNTSKQEIQRFKEDQEFATASCTGSTNMETVFAAQFQYGHSLIHSADLGDVPLGIQVLQKLIREHHDAAARRDYTYYVGVGLYRRKEYEQVISEMKKILKFEKSNHQAAQLKEAAEKKLARDGLIGMGIAAGVAGVAGAGIAALIGIAAAKR